MAVLLVLLVHFSCIQIMNKADSSVISRDYKTENILRTGPLTERHSEEQGWTYEWTQIYNCPPGTFITGYNLRYSSGDHSLENIAAVCSQLKNYNSREGAEIVRNVLNVGALQTDGQQPLGSYRSENQATENNFTFSRTNLPSSYADGFVSLVRERGNNADHVVESQYGLSFHDQPVKWTLEVIKRQEEHDAGRSWKTQKVLVSRCTAEFALCGFSAELQRKNDYSEGRKNASRIHRLDFNCCYVCFPTETWQPIGSSTSKNNNGGPGPDTVDLPVRIGVEFQPGTTATTKLDRSTGQASGGVSNGVTKQSYCKVDNSPLALSFPSPISVHFFYSTFGAKLVMPLVRTVENEHNSIADGTSVTSLHPPVSYKRRSGTSSINRTNEAVFGDEHNYYCYEDKDLRMRGVQNDEFTPRIRWCRSYWRTVWHGAKELLTSLSQVDSKAAGLSLSSHVWGKEHELFEDIRIEQVILPPNRANNGSDYKYHQLVGQCGLMRVYVPIFCTLRNATTNPTGI